VEFNVYQDHRLAMCFAILSDNIEEVTINNSEVVSKSFPEFWEEFKKLGFDF
jgi:3-phosphoshikimate 1-carboxyvinyltransferase